jgi:signal transduction histidine kinase
MVTSMATIWRGRLGLRPPVADVALALVVSIVAVLEAISGPWGTPAVLLMTLPLIWRRRQPLAVFLLIAAVAVGVFQQAPYAGLTAVMIAAYSVGTYSLHRLLSLGVIFATATIIATVFHAGWPPLPDASAPYVIVLSMWLVGNAIRSRQLRADALADKATRLEREREQATREAVAAEHARIARELHDVVAHSVSVMVVQAGAARHILNKSPHQADEALRAVESSGREAMAELRHLLGLLNHEDDQITLTPQPGLDQLDSLVRRVGEAGLPITLHVEGRPCPLPPGLDLAAYRIVQEALTNALKHADLARTDVILEYREGELKIEILDDGPGRSAGADAGAGHGLVGMRERVALYGGTLEAGPRLERGYAVRAWLPLDGGGP